jgi:hypothetical protein
LQYKRVKKLQAESGIISINPNGEAVTENFAQAFIKACDGVKGARSPLSLSAESEIPLQKAKVTSNIKKEK